MCMVKDACRLISTPTVIEICHAFVSVGERPRDKPNRLVDIGPCQGANKCKRCVYGVLFGSGVIDQAPVLRTTQTACASLLPDTCFLEDFTQDDGSALIRAIVSSVTSGTVPLLQRFSRRL